MKQFVAIFVLVASVTQAALKWDRETCTLSVHPSQVSATTVFGFVNAGQKPVTIARVRVSCGCLSAKLAQRSFAPGERGEIHINFDLRNRTGQQHKSVEIEMEDGSTATLQVECKIPPTYISEPKQVLWKKGDPATSKTVRLSNPRSQPIPLLRITSSNPGLPAELKTIREGFEYKVIVTRKTPSPNLRSVIRITPAPPPGLAKSKTIKLYVHAQ